MIKVRGVTKSFNGQPVLSDINLDVPDAEILAILGESGSGKSVLLKHLIGLLHPEQGSIEVNGVDITKLAERELLKFRKNLGYLFQEGALYDFMTVFENVAFPLREHTRFKFQDIKKKVLDTLSLVGLKDAAGKFPLELSGGMKKRAALARSIILDSKLILCDEPTSGLDPIRSRDISELIRSVARQLKCTMVITSHDIANSFRIADKLILIRNGKIVASGTQAQLQASTDPFVKEFLRI